METINIGRRPVEDWRTALPDRPPGYALRSDQTINLIVIHHSASPVVEPPVIHQYHQTAHGWPGIGYHFLVYPDGRVCYVGDLRTVRYHAQRLNGRAIGLCLVGDFRQTPPGEWHLAAARDLIANLQYAYGQWFPVVGHGEVNPTRCPGDTWPTWRARLQVRPPRPPEGERHAPGLA